MTSRPAASESEGRTVRLRLDNVGNAFPGRAPEGRKSLAIVGVPADTDDAAVCMLARRALRTRKPDRRHGLWPFALLTGTPDT